MGRLLGSKNKKSATPSLFHLSIEERVGLLADLIIEKIIEDQRNGKHLINVLEEANAAAASTQQDS